MPDLEGKVLEQIRVNIVVPEFNVVFIQADAQVYALQGEIGSEILGITKVEKLPDLTEQDYYSIRSYPPYDRFLGKTIVQVRMIGAAWNGHGFEISFRELPGETMIIQSIYSGEKEKEFGDCLRLGIGTYEWNSERVGGGNA